MSKKIALISVYNKEGIVDLAKKLKDTYIILASGGTAQVLEDEGIEITRVDEYTGSPEILGGRVKTLHPRIHGGILSKTTDDHKNQLAENDMKEIDLVICNLYPFEKTLEEGATDEEVIEMIDIGGPTLLRAAAKNFERVTVICDPEDYQDVLEKKDEREYRKYLATKVFSTVTRYDLAIAKYMGSTDGILGEQVRKLRYGENPHQQASLYSSGDLFYEQISGKEVSYNNILDVKEGWTLVQEFEKPACVVIKHRTPCGVGVANTAAEAYNSALVGDKMSAFGGVYCFNCPVDKATADLLSKMFIDVLIAPDYSDEALDIISIKKTVLLKSTRAKRLERDIHEIPGGFVMQESDHHQLSTGDYKVVTEKGVDENTIEELLFAWKVVKNSRSNAIAICKGSTALGIGSGQTSRIDAAKQAVEKAGDEVHGAVLASDAFFPFRDTVDLVAEAGIKAIIVPSGSIRDQESIDAANEHGIVMVHTKFRSFKH